MGLYGIIHWKNIILNCLRFIPLGIVLPLGIKWFRRFWKTYLAGFGCSLLIELIQLVCRKGIFQWDDLLGNTVGTMIGYGMFAVILAMNQKSVRKLYLLTLQFPLLITLSTLLLIFLQYRSLELGINPNNYVEAYNSNLIHVAENDFSQETAKLPVYTVEMLSIDETQKRGERILEALGSVLDDSDLDIYNETLVMGSEDDRYSLWVDYYGGTYQLVDYGTLYPDTGVHPQPKAGATEEEIREAVSELGVTIPDESEFMEMDAGIYRFIVGVAETDNGLMDGTIDCQYYGKYGIGRLTVQALNATYYKEFDAISEQEAYQRIVDGKFRYAGQGDLTIHIESCSIVYCVDSKGYYQPNYCFRCNINGKEDEIIIPALK